MRAAAVVVPLAVAATLVTGCTRQEPDVTLEEQVPAEARTGGTETEAGGGGEPPPAATVLTFVVVDIAYAEAPGEAPAGELEVEIVNEGNLPHNVVFEGVRGDSEIAEAEGGETATGSVELDAGTYTYYCSVPGHREAGMEGELAVD
jgi:plastocyanin